MLVPNNFLSVCSLGGLWNAAHATNPRRRCQRTRLCRSCPAQSETAIVGHEQAGGGAGRMPIHAMRPKVGRTVQAALALLITVFASPAVAQNADVYPSRSVRII